MVLQQALEFVLDVRGGTFLDTRLYATIGANDIAQLIRQVVLAAHALAGAVDGYTGANRWRRDREDGEDHPLWASVVGVETQKRERVVAKGLENIERVLRGDGPLLFALAFVVILLRLERSRKLQALLPDRVWLPAATSAVGDLNVLLAVVIGDVLGAVASTLGEPPYGIESLLRVFDADGSLPVGVILERAVSIIESSDMHRVCVFLHRKTYIVGQYQATAVAHRLEDLLDLHDKACWC